MCRLFVRLDRRAIETLVSVAEREHRTPQDQAAVLIERALGLRTGCNCDREAGQSSPDTEPSSSSSTNRFTPLQGTVADQ